ncbi:hypothetical protein EON81_08930 [bacterium]|nr:MAG: hypothetical protein EON81_08930 [bacterium]
MKRSLAVSLIAVAGAFLAGCGSGDSDVVDDTKSAPGPSSGVSGKGDAMSEATQTAPVTAPDSKE